MKGMFQVRPSLQKHHAIWDVKQIFYFFHSQPQVGGPSLKDLTSRIVILLCLLSGQRCQTIQYLNVEHRDVTEAEYTFHIVEKLKHTCPGVHQKLLRFIKYDIEPRLCIYRHLKEYLDCTSLFRADQKQPLISFVRHHSAVSGTHFRVGVARFWNKSALIFPNTLLIAPVQLSRRALQERNSI